MRLLVASLLIVTSATAFSAGTSSSTTSGSHAWYRAFFPRAGRREHSSHVGLHAAVASTVSMENLAILSEKGRAALVKLIESDAHDQVQTHIYADWPEVGVEDDGKKRLADQIADLDESYPGGLPAYLRKAKVLLRESADGVNPFDDYEAFVPDGEMLSFEGNDSTSPTPKQISMNFSQAEQAGLKAMAGAAFVLVAGGLGERLGYSGIKLELETNLCTNECYLEVYVRYIQAMQYLARIQTGRDDIRIPLVIMTSDDTDPLTRKLLLENGNFGLDDNLITIVTQDKVAALKDVSARLALDDDDRWTIQTKPHGHGDVHHLLLKEGLIDKWEEEGKTHVIFLQDTNALVINSIVPTLGISINKNFHMNSICIPRLAGEAAGAIARLEHKTDSSKSLVINVEYNQLDPLLRTQGDCLGDVADPLTGYSPFPGNANNLVIELKSYAKTLRGEDQGVVLEFVNPKYKDATRTEFTKPTRLECMMQDIPKLFQKEMGPECNIGFTTFDRWFCFSPAKNALAAGQAAVRSGSNAPGTMSSAESDKYIQNQRKLKFVGCSLDVTVKPEDYVTYAGILVSPGPRIVLCPAFAISQSELIEKICGPVNISKRSSLVLDGHHLKINGLELDGALVIRAGENSHVTVNGLAVNNKGWELVELDPDQSYPEHVAIRGYTMTKHETKEYVITEPGHFAIGPDGLITRLSD